MNAKKLLISFFVLPLLVACKKDNNKNATPVLIAKWNIVTDYTANHLAQINTYTGVSGITLISIRTENATLKKVANMIHCHIP